MCNVLPRDPSCPPLVTTTTTPVAVTTTSTTLAPTTTTTVATVAAVNLCTAPDGSQYTYQGSGQLAGGCYPTTTSTVVAAVPPIHQLPMTGAGEASLGLLGAVLLFGGLIVLKAERLRGQR